MQFCETNPPLDQNSTGDRSCGDETALRRFRFLLQVVYCHSNRFRTASLSMPATLYA
jgi:hypothetical protein